MGNLKLIKPVYIRAGILLFILIMIIIPSASCGGSDESNKTTMIRSVEIIPKTSEIKIIAALDDQFVRNNRDGRIYLFELRPNQTADDDTLRTLVPISEAKVASSVSFTVTLGDNTRTRLYSSFIIANRNAAGGYTPVSEARYVSNPDVLAQSQFSYPEPSSIKGLSVSMSADAGLLGVSHTTLTLPVNEFLLGEGDRSAVTYSFEGKTYYVDRDQLTMFDHKVRTLSDAGITVYINIVLTPMTAATHPNLRVLYFEGAAGGADYYAADIGDPEAAAYICGFFEFIAERYTSPGREYGFAGSFIIGREVNSNRWSNHAGAMSLEDYAAGYAALVRIADTALRSKYSGGRVYIPLGGNFNSAQPVGRPAPEAADIGLDYTAREFIEALQRRFFYGGELLWNIAVTAYPTNPANTAIWADELCTDDVNTPYISMKNISVLSAYFGEERYLCAGERRRIIINEFAVSAATEVESALEQQAAAYAYAYLQAAGDGNIDAFIYSSHVDNPASPYRTGLWTGSPASPLSRKPVYNMFRYIDTAGGAEYINRIKKQISAEFADIDELIAKLAKRTLIEEYAQKPEKDTKKYDARVLFDFTGGVSHGIYPSDNAGYVELRADPFPQAGTGVSALYARLNRRYPGEFMGVSRAGIDAELFGKTVYAAVTLLAEVPGGVLAQSEAEVMLRLYSAGGEGSGDGGIYYEGRQKISTGNWVELFFPLGEFAGGSGELMMNIWILPGNEVPDGNAGEGEYGLWLRGITLYNKRTPVVLLVLIWLAAAALAAFALFTGYRMILRRKFRGANASRIGFSKLPNSTAAANGRRIPAKIPGKSSGNRGMNQKQTRPGQMQMGQTGQNQIPPGQARQGQTGQNQIQQGQARQGQTGQNQIPPEQARQGQTGQNQISPKQTRQGQTGQNQIPQEQVQSRQTGQTQTPPRQTGKALGDGDPDKKTSRTLLGTSDKNKRSKKKDIFDVDE